MSVPLAVVTAVALSLAPALAAMRADAARRAGVEASQVTVLRQEPVTWTDGSLGCPQPGVAYTQALVPGFRLELRAGGKAWDYHASARGFWVFCPAGRGKPPAPDSPQLSIRTIVGDGMLVVPPYTMEPR